MRTLAIVLLLILALVLVTVSCDSGESITPTPTPSFSPTPALERGGLKLIHKDAEGGAYFHMDIARADQDLAEVYDSFAASVSEDEEELQDLGIELSQMDYVAMQMEEYGQTAGVIYGQFDFENIRDSLSDLDLTQGSYEGVEFWSGYYSTYGDMGVAILADGLIWGDEEVAKSLVRTIEGSDPSFHEMPKVKEVLDRLPGWTPLMAMVSLNPLSDFDIPYAESAGYAIAKEDRNNLKYRMVVKFLDSDIAQQMLETMMGDPATETRRDGSFVIVDAKMPIEDFY